MTRVVAPLVAWFAWVALGACSPGNSGDDDDVAGDDAGVQSDGGGGPCTADRECDDGIACTLDHCEDGACAHGPCLDCCRDGFACIVGLGCSGAPEPCTEDADCVDAVRCTLDRCRDRDSCEHVPQGELCDDGEICLAALGCIPSPPEECAEDGDCFGDRACLGVWDCDAEFGCQFVSATDCDDGDDCTLDSCDEDAGGCVHEAQDADGDGAASDVCGGDDCDDDDPEVHPGATDICNGRDDDCDDEVDEDATCTPGAEQACQTDCGSPGTQTCGADCTFGACVGPAEECNGEDDDCDGTVDEGFACAVGEDGDCATDCGSTGRRTCLGDCTWDDCVPPAETCNGADDDCDGTADDSFACAAGAQGNCQTGCGSTGTRTCQGDCTWGSCTPPAESCNGEDDDCDGTADENFACRAGAVGNCPTVCGSTGTRTCLGDCSWDLCTPPAETCNGVDDDCDNACDDGFTCCAGSQRDCVGLGFDRGQATCLANCSGWDTSTCSRCGDNVRNGPEECDGPDLAGETCLTQGFEGGDLACGVACTFDTRACTSFDPTGVYGIVPSASYQCAEILPGWFLVDFSINSMTFVQFGGQLTVQGAPCDMNGLRVAGGNFSVTCTLQGTCDETYSLTGTFLDADTWQGTFTAEFSGADCLDCTDQSWDVTGSR